MVGIDLWRGVREEEDGRRTKGQPGQAKQITNGGPRCHQEHFCKGEAQKIFGRLGKRGQPRKARGRGE